jgi:hypothetical protein
VVEMMVVYEVIVVVDRFVVLDNVETEVVVFW